MIPVGTLRLPLFCPELNELIKLGLLSTKIMNLMRLIWITYFPVATTDGNYGLVFQMMNFAFVEFADILTWCSVDMHLAVDFIA